MNTHSYILVDDDPSHNMLCTAIIKRVFKGSDVNAFLEPEKALKYIESVYIDGKNSTDNVEDYNLKNTLDPDIPSESSVPTVDIQEGALNKTELSSGSEKPTVLFLDINMPSMTGWEFLEEFRKFSKTVHKQFTIYMLSSSVDSSDKEKASSNIFVSGYISKPLRQETLREKFQVV
ncbi:hypothetical protein BH10BAC5_BH10BAC5_22820 [soil metagenome]